MTRERAIEVLKAWNLNWSDEFTANEFEQAFAMAIKALEQEPCCNCIEFKRYAKEMGFEIDQESVLDKIRAEIEEVYNDRPRSYNNTQRRELFCKVIEIIDKYRQKVRLKNDL
jgi:hypothetical protein